MRLRSKRGTIPHQLLVINFIDSWKSVFITSLIVFDPKCEKPAPFAIPKESSLDFKLVCSTSNQKFIFTVELL